jgi:hypothetical protein
MSYNLLVKICIAEMDVSFDSKLSKFTTSNKKKLIPFTYILSFFLILNFNVENFY